MRTLLAFAFWYLVTTNVLPDVSSEAAAIGFAIGFIMATIVCIAQDINEFLKRAN